MLISIVGGEYGSWIDIGIGVHGIATEGLFCVLNENNNHMIRGRMIWVDKWWFT